VRVRARVKHGPAGPRPVSTHLIQLVAPGRERPKQLLPPQGAHGIHKALGLLLRVCQRVQSWVEGDRVGGKGGG